MRRLELSLLAAAAALPLLVFGAAMAWLFGQQAQLGVEQQLRFAARSALAAVDRLIAAELGALDMLARAARLDEPGGLDAFRLMAGRTLAAREHWLAVRVTDASGRLTFDLRKESAAASAGTDARRIAEAASLARPVAGGFLGAPATGGRPAIGLHAPAAGDGAPAVVLTLELATDAVSDELRAQPAPEGWTLAALDRDRIVVGRARAAERYVGLPATASLAAELGRQPESFFFALNQEGERLYTAFSTSPFSGWSVAVGAPAAAVEARARRSLLAAAAGGAGALALSLALGVGMIRASMRRHEAERRLLEAQAASAAERRIADVAENLPGIVYRRILHPDGRFGYLDVRGDVQGLFFVPREEFLRMSTLEEQVRRLAAEDRQAWVDAVRRSAAELTPFDHTSRVRAPDGSIRWVRSIAKPRRLPDGAVVWDGVSLDVTDLVAAERALRISEQRFRDVVETASDWVWETDAEHRFTYFSDTMAEATGLPVERLLGLRRVDLVAEPAQGSDLQAHLADLAARRPFRNFVFWTKAEFGRRCLSSSGRPVFDEQGVFVGYRGAGSDVTERERAANQRELMMAELDHRVKNSLAVVKAVVEQTARSARTIEEFRADLEGRLRALADTHDQLRAARWQGASFRDLLERALAAHDGRIEIVHSGDAVLPPAAASAFAMALHELATNAAKHGALSRPEGRVELRWTMERGELRLTWREFGGPPVPPAPARGFGRQMIERGLAYELGAEVSLRFAPEGVVCEIRVPLGAGGEGGRPIAAAGSAA